MVLVGGQVLILLAAARRVLLLADQVLKNSSIR